MKNVLIIVPSLYRENADEKIFWLYYPPNTMISARHTNLPVFYSVSKKLMRSGERIDAVLMLTTEEVRNDVKLTDIGEMTTYEYLTKRFAQYQNGNGQKDIRFVSLSITAGEIRNTEAMQKQVNEAFRELEADSDTRIWVDFTSGLRSHAILLIFMLRLIEMRRLGRIEDILYANLTGNRVNQIESCMAVYRLFDRYSLIDRVGNTLSEEHVARGNETGRQRESNEAFYELNHIYSDLTAELINTAGNTTEVTEKIREKAESYMKEYAWSPLVCELASRILQGCRYDDALSSTEFFLDMGMPSLAAIKLRENAFRFLLESGVIETRHTAAEIETEITSAEKYYKSFYDYMRRYLVELRRKPDESPQSLYTDDCSSVLMERERCNPDNERELVPMNEKTEGRFRSDCAELVDGLQTSFAQVIQRIAQSTNAYEKKVQEYENVRRACSEKERRYKLIYRSTGFPLPCFNQKGTYYYNFYQRYLWEAGREIVYLLERKQRRWKMPVLSHIDSSRLDLDLANLNYTDTIDCCIDHLKDIVPLRYSYQSDRGAEYEWNSGLEDRDALQRFLNDYLPDHDLIRQLRNEYAHPDETNDQTSRTSADKSDIVRNCLKKLRDIASKERRRNATYSGNL